MQIHKDPGGTWEWASALPDARLSPGVIRYRGYRLALGLPRQRLEVPADAVTLVINFDGELRLTDVRDPGTATTHRFLTCGLRTSATLGEHDGSLYGVEVVLTPWAAFTLLGVAMQECSETVVDASELLGRRVDELAESLASRSRWEERFELLDITLTRWAAGGPACPPRIVWAWDQLARTSGRTRIQDVAEGSGWGRRQFEYRFRRHIGVPAKSAARIMRLQRALRLLSEGRAPVEAATASGFFDQAHLTREVTTMTGRPPTRLLAARRRAAPGPGARDRLDGRITSVLVPR
ncbi:helix-turn-helix domain-containing protein [Streptomyces sp. Tu 3180]|uniref:helix-turn-helix domain-containing protein n=1 Tax=Streptomyces sp. Tu 3180 TaxID=2682611 RepID=UPI001357BAC4|nr:helix-turn-helix domain-containing protein [Streptomyces sp. Tu 3180]KAF3465678.1 helix-turn-helix domain-containing protein [Streptomyces sp. Tu 3180]